jgi:hypothetical protein
MRWSPEKRTRIFETLDSTERLLIVLMRVLLWVALLGVMALVVIAIVTRRPGGNTQGEYYYFGAAAIIVVSLILSRFAKLRAREREMASRLHRGSDASPPWTVTSSTDSVPLPDERGHTRVRSWKFSFGHPPDAGESADDVATTFNLSRSFNIPLASLPADVVPDDATLDAAAAGLQRGESLDDVCASIEPSYRGWSGMQRQAYRFLIESSLGTRRNRGGIG